MYSLLPPVLFPGESPLSREVRICLLLAFLVHLAAIPFLARAPCGPLTMPVVFFLGVTVLWAVPGILVFQTVVYAINALVLLLGAWAIRGAREGEYLLFLAGAVPFLAAALPMGYAQPGLHPQPGNSRRAYPELPGPFQIPGRQFPVRPLVVRPRR
jgi:hypothetical protein